MACAALGLVACRQILGLDVAPEGQKADGGSDGSGSCSTFPGTAECQSCTLTQCCSESSACAQDPNCTQYETCLATCKGEPYCRSVCTETHPVPAMSSAAVSALSACLAANCESECGLTCGGFAAYLSDHTTSAMCQQCLIDNNACPHAQACASSADCDAYWRCVVACPTIDCKEACPLDHDAGFAQFKTLFQDFSGVCAPKCGFGSYWACAGHVAGYPVPKAGLTHLNWTNWLYDVGNQAPVVGATVTACANCPCPTPTFPMLGHAQTGPDGFFTLNIQLTRASNGQAQLFCIETNAPGYDTTFFFPGLPFSEQNTTIKDGLGPPVSLGLLAFSPSNVQGFVNGLFMSSHKMGQYDPTRGVIAAGIFDCFANPANGVLVSIGSNDPLAALADPVDGGADAGLATLSGGGNTNGHAVFFNLEAGSYVITATPPGLSTPVDQVTVTVASGTVSQVGVFPSPPP
jgi:hypothetical protein